MKKTLSWIKGTFDRKGSVLIEFAFCCPVLVILLFFVLDVPLAYRVLLKMQKISELTANMIRNIPGKSNTQITINDLKNVSKAAGITLTGRLGSSSKPCSRYPFYLSTYVFCIEGNSSGGFDTKWNVHVKNNLYNGTITANTNDTAMYSKIQGVNKFSGIDGLENFTIHEGETKLIIETVAWYKESENASIERVSNGSGNGGSGSNLFGDYNKNKSRVRGFNKNFYLLTIPGRTVPTGEKVFGNRFAIMPCIDDIVNSEESPE